MRRVSDHISLAVVVARRYSPVGQFGDHSCLVYGRRDLFMSGTKDCRMSTIGIGTISALLFFSRDAFAYIDPGVTYALLQALFIFIFGAASAFIVRPWTWIKSWFKKPDLQDTMPLVESEAGSESPCDSDE